MIDRLARDSDVMLVVRADTVGMVFEVGFGIDLPLAVVSSLAGCGSACILPLSKFSLMVRTIATID